jgi:hypothetical protein
LHGFPAFYCSSSPQLADVVCSWPDDSDRSSPGTLKVIRNLSASFPTAPGSDTAIDSKELRRWMASVAKSNTDFLVQLVEAHNKLVPLLCVLLTFPFRGQPRFTEIARTLIGTTNAMTVDHTRPNIYASYTPGSDASRILRCEFKPRKAGVSTSPCLCALPDCLSSLFAFFCSLLRPTLVEHLSSEPDVEQMKLVLSGVNLAVRFTAEEKGQQEARKLAVRAWATDPLSQHCQKLLCVALAIRDGALTFEMWRQVHAAIGTDIADLASPTPTTDPSVAHGFNHSLRTHDANYHSRIETPFGPRSRKAMDHSDFLDLRKQEFLSCIGRDFIHGNTDWPLRGRVRTRENSLPKGCAIRLPTNEQCLSFVRLATGNDNAQSRPNQFTILRAALSLGDGDNHLVFGCGNGKTIATFALMAYTLIQQVAKEEQRSLQENLLTTRLRLKPNIGEGGQSLSEAVAKILDDTNSLYRPILEFAQSDPHLLPEQSFVLVLTPFTLAADELCKEINRSPLVHAWLWNDETEKDVLNDVKYAVANPTKGFRFQVLVATVFYALLPDSQILLNLATYNKFILQIVVDEAHCLVQNASFQRELQLVRSIPRHHTKICTMTGTMPTCMDLVCTRMAGSSAGRELLETSALPVVCSLPEPDQRNLREAYISERGIKRAPSTISDHIFHSRIEERELSPTSEVFVESLLHFVRNLRELGFHTSAGASEPWRADAVLVLVSNKSLVSRYSERAREVFGPASVAELVGGEGIDKSSAFNRRWTHATDGSCFLAFATSIGAQSINNLRCNTVITVQYYFTCQDLVQAANRAGRGGQQSFHFSISSETAFDTASTNNTQLTDWSSLAALGLDVSSPETKRALSVYGLKEFFVNPPRQSGSRQAPIPRCRRSVLKEEMDGVMQAEPPPPLCCDVCLGKVQPAPFSATMLWQHARSQSSESRTEQESVVETEVEPGEGEGSVVGMGVETAIIDDNNAYDDFLNQIDTSEFDYLVHAADEAQRQEGFNPPPEQINEQEREMNIMEEGERLLGRELASLQVQPPPLTALPVDVIHFLQEQADGRCVWHRTALPHPPTAIPGGTCKSDLNRFLGRAPNSNFCFKCGGDFTPAHAARCNAHNLTVTGVCRYCLCDHRAINLPTSGTCELDYRVKMLVVWAFRTSDGYRLTYRNYQSPGQGLAHENFTFPEFAGFRERQELWFTAVNWITQTAVHNKAFWIACVRALQQRSSPR